VVGEEAEGDGGCEVCGGSFGLVDGLFGGNHLLWCTAEVYCAGFVGFWVGVDVAAVVFDDGG